MSTRAGGSAAPSAVDLVSNAVILSGIDGDDAVRLVHPGRFPDRLMPSVLHEAAHWDTFATPVGNALALAFLRAWRRTQVPSEENEYESVMDLTRYRVFYELLRPLTEGLALFSEFDLMPSDSPVTSTPTLLAGVMFGDRDIVKQIESLTVGQLARLNLSVARPHPIFQARKEHLLCQNFDVKDGGYLPGYFFVKNLRNYLLRRQLLDLLDGDLFLYCVRAAVFGDLTLARLMVDPALDFIMADDPADAHRVVHRDAINAVFQRFQQLIEFLIHDMDQNYIDRVAEVTVRPSWSWNELPQPIAGERTDGSDMGVVLAQLELVAREGSPGSAETRTANVCRRFFENRGLMCLASVDARIRVNEHGRCMISTREFEGMAIPHMVIPALPDVGTHDARGTYELYLDRSVAGGQILFSAVVDHQCVAAGGINPDKELDIDAFAARRPSLASASRLCAQIDDDLEAALGDHPILEHYQKQIEGTTFDLYDRYCGAFFELAGGDKNELRKKLMTVAGSDLMFIADYAALSLVSSGIFAGTDALKNACARLKIDEASFLATLNTWKAEKRFALHEQRGQVLYLLF